MLCCMVSFIIVAWTTFQKQEPRLLPTEDEELAKSFQKLRLCSAGLKELRNPSTGTACSASVAHPGR